MNVLWNRCERHQAVDMRRQGLSAIYVLSLIVPESQSLEVRELGASGRLLKDSEGAEGKPVVEDDKFPSS